VRGRGGTAWGMEQQRGHLPFCTCGMSRALARLLDRTDAPSLRCRFTPPWQPVLSAVTRQAPLLPSRHLPLLLRALLRGGAGRDTHLVDALAARLLEDLPSALQQQQRQQRVQESAEGGHANLAQPPPTMSLQVGSRVAATAITVTATAAHSPPADLPLPLPLILLLPPLLSAGIGHQLLLPVVHGGDLAAPGCSGGGGGEGGPALPEPTPAASASAGPCRSTWLWARPRAVIYCLGTRGRSTEPLPVCEQPGRPPLGPRTPSEASRRRWRRGHALRPLHG
jgi:hypothetical protein